MIKPPRVPSAGAKTNSLKLVPKVVLIYSPASFSDHDLLSETTLYVGAPELYLNGSDGSQLTRLNELCRHMVHFFLSNMTDAKVSRIIFILKRTNINTGPSSLLLNKFA